MRSRIAYIVSPLNDEAPIIRTFSAPLPGFNRASSYKASGVSHLFFISVTADEDEKERETRLLLSKAEDAEDEAIARERE